MEKQMEHEWGTRIGYTPSWLLGWFHYILGLLKYFHTQQSWVFGNITHSQTIYWWHVHSILLFDDTTKGYKG